MVNAFWAAAASFTATALLCPPLIRVVKRFKARQVVSDYVKEHKSKSGTPTMGGIALLAGIAVSALFFVRNSRLAAVATAVTAAYGAVGFLDDFLKIKFKRNLGLRAYQKIITQLLVAAAVAVFAYNSRFIGGEIYIPFSFKTLDLGIWLIPFAVLVFLACSNSVNLTDGLDALASSVNFFYTAAFAAVLVIVRNRLADGGADSETLAEYANLVTLCGGTAGASAAFILFNGYPAKIFMGDCGSLALGGMAASVALFSRLSLLVPILGAMFVASSLSVIMQVAYFKTTGGGRIFLMSPLHHHFQMKGAFEGRIVLAYAAITLVIGLLTVGVYSSI